jgi:hypothetical protein
MTIELEKNQGEALLDPFDSLLEATRVVPVEISEILKGNLFLADIIFEQNSLEGGDTRLAIGAERWLIFKTAPSPKQVFWGSDLAQFDKTLVRYLLYEGITVSPTGLVEQEVVNANSDLQGVRVPLTKLYRTATVTSLVGSRILVKGMTLGGTGVGQTNIGGAINGRQALKLKQDTWYGLRLNNYSGSIANGLVQSQFIEVELD